jgi:hypothetical protein
MTAKALTILPGVASGSAKCNKVGGCRKHQ